jgi:AcrR family transcriptional regulator
MGTKERRLREIEEMRHEIIEAAVQLFLTEGYQHVSMRKIAAKIDYSATAIYNYFANKEEILIHLLKHAYGQFLRSLKEGIVSSEGQNELERLKAALHAYIGFGLQYPDYYQLIFIENAHQMQKVISRDNDRYRGFILLTEMVTGAMDAGFLKRNDIQMVSQSLWASLHGITSLLSTFPAFDWHGKEEWVSFHVEAMVRGLR